MLNLYTVLNVTHIYNHTAAILSRSHIQWHRHFYTGKWKRFVIPQLPFTLWLFLQRSGWTSLVSLFITKFITLALGATSLKLLVGKLAPKLVYFELRKELLKLQWYGTQVKIAALPTIHFISQLSLLSWIGCRINCFILLEFYLYDVLQVTVFGHSSGGSSVMMLLSTELSVGLFHRAWASSSSNKLDTTYNEAADFNQKLVNKTECLNKACLLNLR